MNINACPHCNNFWFGFWAKISLGPERKRRCRNCDGVVSASKSYGTAHLLTLGLIPLFFCLLSIAIADSASAGWWMPVAGILVGVMFELWLYYRAVPLVAHTT